MATILGLGGSDHDVNACLLRDGQVVVTIEDERLSRKKYGLGGNLLEARAAQYCLTTAGLTLDDVDEVVADAILAPTAMAFARKRTRRIDHHLAHAASAWFTSGFETGAILVVDNAGGLVTDDGLPGLQASSWYRADRRDIRRLGRVLSRGWHDGPRVAGTVYQRGDGDDSLGHFYKKVSGALGYRFPRHRPADAFFFPEDGVTMALAAYGDARFTEAVWSLAELLPNGRYRLALNDGRLDALLARWLASADDFDTRAAVAAAAQEVLTRVLCHLAEAAVSAAGTRDLCLAGGVAMNSVANGEILRRTSVERLHVPPAPGDNGTGLGAALWSAARDPAMPIPVYSVYAGRRYSAAEIDAAVQALDPVAFRVARLSAAELIDELVAHLTAGHVVAWYEGGVEHGRRALGHRSILADPRKADVRDRLNLLKGREWFRPFAPVVSHAEAHRYFALPHASPYMQIVVPVHVGWRGELAAVTHVDGRARVQTVRAEDHPRLHALLVTFARVAGAPILLNTSFNAGGEPIVETPAHAVDTFVRMPLDALVLEDCLVSRR